MLAGKMERERARERENGGGGGGSVRCVPKVMQNAMAKYSVRVMISM